MKKALTTLVAVLLVVIVAQWFMFSRIRHENDVLRDAKAQAGQSRAELEMATENARQREAEAQSLRTELASLRGEFQRLRQELDRTSTAGDRATPEHSPAQRPGAVQSEASPSKVSTPSKVVITPTDIDPDSLRVFGPERGANLRVKFLGKSSDEIGAMAGIQKCDIVIDGQVAIGAGRFVEGGTNAGLTLVFDTRAQAEAAAAALRQRPQ
jgi:hypothetical protein